MKINKYLIILILILSSFNFVYSLDKRNVSYKDFKYLDSNKELFKSTMEYYEMYSKKDYIFQTIDSNYFYKQLKDSSSLGNKIIFYKDSVIMKQFNAIHIFDNTIYFQEKVEFMEDNSLIVYKSSNYPARNNVFIYNYKLNKIIDTINNIYYYNLDNEHSNKVFLYSERNNKKYLTSYNIINKNSILLDSTKDLIEYLSIYPYQNMYLKTKSNFFENEISLLDSNFNLYCFVHKKDGTRYDLVSWQKDTIFFKIKAKGFNDRIARFPLNINKNEIIYDSIKQNQITARENDKFLFMIYDSILYKKIVIQDKISLKIYNFELGRYNFQYANFDSSGIFANYGSASKYFKFYFNFHKLNFSIDTIVINKNICDTLIVLKNKDHYIGYFYNYKNPNQISKKICLLAYGGYDAIHSPPNLDNYLHDLNIGIAQAMLSGDGNFGWNSFLNGNKENIENVIDDIKTITNDIYSRKFCSKKSVILIGESYGALNCLSTFCKFPEIYDSGIFIAGDYNISKSIELNNAHIEQHGDIKKSKIFEIYKNISPIESIKKNKTIPPLLIMSNEYDTNVNNETVDEVLLSLDNQNIEYYYKKIKGVDHLNSRGYYQAIDQFYLQNLFLLSRLRK